MMDIAIDVVKSITGDSFDMQVSSNDLVLDEGLRSSVVVSLFSDARATTDDEPNFQGDRRGWWGDMLNEIPQDFSGSKLWLLERAKQTNESRIKAEEYATDALQWMIDDGIAAKISATASFPGDRILSIVVVITRPSGDTVSYTFDFAWKAEGAR